MSLLREGFDIIKALCTIRGVSSRGTGWCPGTITEIENEARNPSFAPQPGDGSKVSRSYLVDSGVVTLPRVGALRRSQDTTRNGKLGSLTTLS